MNEKVKAVPKSILKVAAKMTGTVALFFVVGGILNWAYSLRILFDLGDGSFLLKVLLALIFLAGFPFAYFWMGKSHAINIGLNQIYSSNQGFFEGIVTKITSGVINKTSGGSGITGGIINSAVGVAKTTQKLPTPIKWVLNFFLTQIPLMEAITKAKTEVEFTSDNANVAGSKVFEHVNEYVKDELLDTGLMWFWILLAINIAAIVLSYYFLIAG